MASPKKLSALVRQRLEEELVKFSFTCGASICELDPDTFSDIHARDLRCNEPVEKLFYAMDYDPICIHCSAEEDLVTAKEYYPICESCNDSGKPRIPKRGN